MYLAHRDEGANQVFAEPMDCLKYRTKVLALSRGEGWSGGVP